MVDGGWYDKYFTPANFDKDVEEGALQANEKLTIVGLVMAAESRSGENVFDTVEPGKLN